MRNHNYFGRLVEKFRQSETFSDQYLLKKVKKGDGEAFGKLYMKYLDQTYRYIFFRVNQNSEVAEDLAEMVFFKAWENIRRFKGNGISFKSWLYAIAHNTVIDHYRQQKRNRTLSLNGHEDTIVDTKNIPEENLVRENEIEDLKKAMRGLTGDQKEIITLKFIEGLSNKELGTILNKNEDAIRALQHRALRKLRQILKPVE